MNPLFRQLISSTGVVVGCCVLGFSLICFGASLAKSAEAKAQASILEAHYAERKAKHETLQAYIELEAKRTNVQREIRAIVIAEMRRCKKAGGKC